MKTATRDDLWLVMSCGASRVGAVTRVLATFHKELGIKLVEPKKGELTKTQAHWENISSFKRTLLNGMSQTARRKFYEKHYGRLS